MNLSIAPEAIYILSALKRAGFEGYIVGGAVRDMILGQTRVTDYDFTTNAAPEQILATFPDGFYENQFGTVMVKPENIRQSIGLKEFTDDPSGQDNNSNRIIDIAAATKIHVSLKAQVSQSTPEYSRANTERNLEITTFRSDGTYEDHRRPNSVIWGTSLAQDLERRDFSINALAIQVHDTILDTDITKLISPSSNLIPLTEADVTIIDNHGGIKDLASGILRTVGDPTARFTEDSLRMLRAIRIAVQLHMSIDQDTYTALAALAPLITHVSWERVRDELLKMLASPDPKAAILLMEDTGILPHILPEILEGKGVMQAGHHTTDVWQHSVDALEACPSSDPIVRLATLLHDVAKPRTHQLQNGKPTFYNHEIVGSRMARSIAQRLKLSKAEQDRIFTLVRFHMFHYQPQNTDASIRRFMRKVGLVNVDDILDLREADRLGSGARKTSWRLEEMKQRMIEQLHQPMEVTDVAINGSDLMSELNLLPGPILGELLKMLLEHVLELPEDNNREKLLQIARDYLERRSQNNSSGTAVNVDE